MEPTRKKTSAEDKHSLNPVEKAKQEAEDAIADDPDFASDPAADDLDEGELANLDNSNDNDL